MRRQGRFALYDQRDANLWESDVVELFFQPSEDSPLYYEFEVAPTTPCSTRVSSTPAARIQALGRVEL